MSGLLRLNAFCETDEKILTSLDKHEPPRQKPKSKAKAKGQCKMPVPAEKKKNPQQKTPSKAAPSKQKSKKNMGAERARDGNADEEAANSNDVNPTLGGDDVGKPAAPKGVRRKKLTEEDLEQLPFPERKKILTSRAYHRVKDKAIRDGLCSTKAAEMGREAASKVSQKLDQDRAQREA